MARIAQIETSEPITGRAGPSAPARRTENAQDYQAAVQRENPYTQEHRAAPLDLEAIAQVAAVSKFHLVRVFDELTGTTPHHFLACLRMQRAKEIMLEGEKSS